MDFLIIKIRFQYSIAKLQSVLALFVKEYWFNLYIDEWLDILQGEDEKYIYLGEFKKEKKNPLIL